MQNGKDDDRLIFAYRHTPGEPHLAACAASPEAALEHLQAVALALYGAGEPESLEAALEALCRACRPEGLHLPGEP